MFLQRDKDKPVLTLAKAPVEMVKCIEDIQNFLLKMAFISSRVVETIYISWMAKPQMKLMKETYLTKTKTFEFSFYYIQQILQREKNSIFTS